MRRQRSTRSRARRAAGAILTLAAIAIGGCVTETAQRDASIRRQSLSGPDVAWVDTVLGATPPPATRIGDLATRRLAAPLAGRSGAALSAPAVTGGWTARRR